MSEWVWGGWRKKNWTTQEVGGAQASELNGIEMKNFNNNKKELRTLEWMRKKSNTDIVFFWMRKKGSRITSVHDNSSARY